MWIVSTCNALVMMSVVVVCLGGIHKPLDKKRATGYESILTEDLADYLWMHLEAVSRMG